MDKTETNFSDSALIFKAFCDENRLKILSLLKDGELCACKLLEQLHINQSTLSHHMKILCDAGIVTPRREGKWTHYSLNADGCKKAQRLLKEIISVSCTEKSSGNGDCSSTVKNKMEKCSCK